MNKQVIEVKPYTVKELSNMYGISDKTLRKWLKPFEESIGMKNGHYFTTLQVQIIFSKLGVPGLTTEL
jgi:transposase-like protein